MSDTSEAVEEASEVIGRYVALSRTGKHALEALLTALQAKEEENAGLVAESADLTKALTGLTCGGSEFFVRKGERFVADIAACVAWVRRTKEDAHNRTVAAIKAEKAAQSALAEAMGALKAVGSLDGEDHKRLCQGREYACSCGFDTERDALISRASDVHSRLLEGVSGEGGRAP